MKKIKILLVFFTFIGLVYFSFEGLILRYDIYQIYKKGVEQDSKYKGDFEIKNPVLDALECHSNNWEEISIFNDIKIRVPVTELQEISGQEEKNKSRLLYDTKSNLRIFLIGKIMREELDFYLTSEMKSYFLSSGMPEVNFEPIDDIPRRIIISGSKNFSIFDYVFNIKEVISEYVFYKLKESFQISPVDDGGIYNFKNTANINFYFLKKMVKKMFGKSSTLLIVKVRGFSTSMDLI